jgi:hypothetical protein
MPNPLHSKHNGDSDPADATRVYRADGPCLLAGSVLLAYAPADVCAWLADRLNKDAPAPGALTGAVLRLLMEHPAPGVFIPCDGLRRAGAL